MVLACQILNFNDFRHTYQLTDRLKRFKLVDYVLIVDNCSTDDSFTLLKQRFNGQTKIRVVKTTSNRGYGSGNNYGVKFAYEHLKADYVLLANPDVRITENVLFELLDKMQTEKETGIVAPTQRINGKVINDRAWKIPTKLEYIFSDTKLSKLISLDSSYSSTFFDDNFSYVDCVPGALLLLNARVFLKVGGFDERMFLYCEETTIGFKLKKHGYKTLLLNNRFYDHVQSTSIGKSIPNVVRQRKYIYHNRLLFLQEYLKAGRLTIWLAQKVYSHILKRMSKVLD